MRRKDWLTSTGTDIYIFLFHFEYIYFILRFERSETTGSGDNRRTYYYKSEENYMDVIIKFAYKTSSDDLYLTVGDHSYPFSIILPSNLPTSFEHSIGYIRYYLYATIDIPW